MINKQRIDKMSRKQQLEHQQNMELPINKFLNSTNEKGEAKYPIASKLRKYFLDNPDPILTDMRMSNALLHELRWHKEQLVSYLLAHKTNNSNNLKDKNGDLMSNANCYLAYISETQNIHIVLSKLREHLVSKLLPKCDGHLLTFELYDEFVRKTEDKVKEMGYDLFPSKVELIEPL